MKIKKTKTHKAIAASKAKARKNTGPTTGAGKHWANMNVKPGFFTRELQISGADRPEFEALRESLTQKYVAPTHVRQIVRDLILSCAWSYKLELRKKNRIIGLQETAHKETKVAAPGGDTILMEQWYGTDHRSLQAGRRFLRALRSDVKENGFLHLKEDGPLKESFIEGFGKTAYDRLTKWEGMSPSAIAMAEHLETMMKTFKMRPPIGLFRGNLEHRAAMSEAVVDRSPGDPEQPVTGKVTFNMTPPPMDPRPGGLEDLGLPKVVADPKLPQQMALKLIDIQIEHLEALDRIRRQDSGKAPHARSESERSLADARRDLQEAIDLFLKVAEKGL